MEGKLKELAEKEKLKQGEMSRLLADMNILQSKKKPTEPEAETVSDLEDEVHDSSRKGTKQRDMSRLLFKSENCGAI